MFLQVRTLLRIILMTSNKYTKINKVKLQWLQNSKQITGSKREKHKMNFFFAN